MDRRAVGRMVLRLYCCDGKRSGDLTELGFLLGHDFTGDDIGAFFVATRFLC